MIPQPKLRAACSPGRWDSGRYSYSLEPGRLSYLKLSHPRLKSCRRHCRLKLRHISPNGQHDASPGSPAGCWERTAAACRGGKPTASSTAEGVCSAGPETKGRPRRASRDRRRGRAHRFAWHRRATGVAGSQLSPGRCDRDISPAMAPRAALLRPARCEDTLNTDCHSARHAAPGRRRGTCLFLQNRPQLRDGVAAPRQNICGGWQGHRLARSNGAGRGASDRRASSLETSSFAVPAQGRHSGPRIAAAHAAVTLAAGSRRGAPIAALPVAAQRGQVTGPRNGTGAPPARFHPGQGDRQGRIGRVPAPRVLPGGKTAPGAWVLTPSCDNAKASRRSRSRAKGPPPRQGACWAIRQALARASGPRIAVAAACGHS